MSHHLFTDAGIYVCTYEHFWDSVIGPDRSASQACAEFDLVVGDFRSFSEWLSEAESITLGQMRLDNDEQREAVRAAWAPHHDKAARELQAAATEEIE